MSKHTPGPWRIVEHNWSDTTIYGGDISNEIACLSIGRIATEKTQAALEATQAANARLIAAAPELLEALNALMESRRRDQFRGWEEGCPDFHKSEELARAAIAKATGVA